MNKLVKSVVFFLCLAVIVSACGGEAAQPQNQAGQAGEKPTYTFKLAHIEKPTSDWNKTAEKFNEELQALSDGRMNAEVFPAGQLGSEADMFQQLASGASDFGFITAAYISTRSETFNGWFMPFLFKNVQEASQAKDSESAKEMLKELDQQGVVGMDYIFAGNHNVLMEEGSAEFADGVKGKKIRIIGNPAIKDFWMNVGASPTPMPLPEVYNALQTGAVDGVHMSIDGIATSKFYEVGNDVTLLNQIAFPAVVLGSKATFEKLSPEDKAIVEEAMKNAVNWGIEQVIANEPVFLEEIRSKGVNVHEVTEINPDFLQARDSVYKTYSDKNPVIKAFIEENQ